MQIQNENAFGLERKRLTQQSWGLLYSAWGKELLKKLDGHKKKQIKTFTNPIQDKCYSFVLFESLTDVVEKVDQEQLASF